MEFFLSVGMTAFKVHVILNKMASWCCGPHCFLKAPQSPTLHVDFFQVLHFHSDAQKPASRCIA